ncbi:MAG: extracellular solute-binding protein, partial [Candidatus Aerophobus sp.]
EVPPYLIEFYWEGYWDEKVHYQTKTGTLYGIPINGNIHLFVYRKDKYEEAGLPTPPETWDDVLLAARKLNNPPEFYGYLPRGARPVYNSTTVRHAYGGYIFADAAHGDFTITINNERNQQAIDMYGKKLAKYAPPGVGLINQAQMMAHLATGKALQAIQVAAAWPHYDDPDFSIVPYKMDYAVPPRANIEGGGHTSTVAIWTMAIPRFISKERKVRALDFLKWLITEEAQVVYTELGAVPVSRSVFETKLMEDKKYRFLKAMRDALPYVGSMPLIPEWSQIGDKLEPHLCRVIVGEEGVKEALDKTAAEILEVMKSAGYKGIRIASSQ